MQNTTALTAALSAAAIPFRENEPMSRHTTFMVGGGAAVFIEPTTTEQVVLAQQLCREQQLRLMPVGHGSNLLVADSGLPFAVLHLGKCYSGIEHIGQDTLRVKSGTKLSALCRYTAEQGLSGLEFGYGIPGNLGGVLYMNAGAYGGEMRNVVRSVTFLDEEGQLVTLEKPQLDFGYRHSVFSGRQCIILWSVLEFMHDDPAEIKAAMDDYMDRRREKQPLEYGSAGSTFKRPQGAFAAALIDQCGLKGYAVGDAQVSKKHAGFVINTGSARCEQVLEVMQHVSDTVLAQTGFLLEPEIMILP